VISNLAFCILLHIEFSCTRIPEILNWTSQACSLPPLPWLGKSKVKAVYWKKYCPPTGTSQVREHHSPPGPTARISLQNCLASCCYIAPLSLFLGAIEPSQALLLRRLSCLHCPRISPRNIISLFFSFWLLSWFFPPLSGKKQAALSSLVPSLRFLLAVFFEFSLF
jgi:hypothetical protein